MQIWTFFIIIAIALALSLKLFVPCNFIFQRRIYHCNNVLEWTVVISSVLKIGHL